MKNLIILSLALAFCLPVHAELLVFKTKNSGQQLSTQTQIAEKKSEQGYLVLDVDMANPADIFINEAYHLTYGKTAGVKTQATIILDPLNVELIIASNNGKNAQMILRWFDDPTGTYTVVFGNAKNTDIGGLSRNIASSAKGNCVWRLQDFMTGYGNITLKLDATNTRSANNQGKTAIDALEELSQSLIDKDYRPDL
jgi:hypothetical protein